MERTWAKRMGRAVVAGAAVMAFVPGCSEESPSPAPTASLSCEPTPADSRRLNSQYSIELFRCRDQVTNRDTKRVDIVHHESNGSTTVAKRNDAQAPNGVGGSFGGTSVVQDDPCEIVNFQTKSYQIQEAQIFPC